MRVYVAAASSDLERAKKWMAELRAVGIEVTSNWPEVIEKVGEANPRNSSWRDRMHWADSDLDGVRRADVVWFLAGDAPGRGAYFELGFALTEGKYLVSSGDTLQSIFLAFTEEHPTDQDAFDCVCTMARESAVPRAVSL